MPALAAPVMRQPVTRPPHRSSTMAVRRARFDVEIADDEAARAAELDQAAPAVGSSGKAPLIVKCSSVIRDRAVIVGEQRGGAGVLQHGRRAGADDVRAGTELRGCGRCSGRRAGPGAAQACGGVVDGGLQARGLVAAAVGARDMVGGRHRRPGAGACVWLCCAAGGRCRKHGQPEAGAIPAVCGRVA